MWEFVFQKFTAPIVDKIPKTDIDNLYTTIYFQDKPIQSFFLNVS